MCFKSPWAPASIRSNMRTNSWRWPAFAFAYLLALAYGASFVTYRAVSWLGSA